jgi:hypothetical protein
MNRRDDEEAVQQYNRATRVISAWVREPEFHDASGQPAPLSVEGDCASFGVLVRHYSGDMSVRAILDELLRVRAVELLEDGRIRLLARSYVPATGTAQLPQQRPWQLTTAPKAPSTVLTRPRTT